MVLEWTFPALDDLEHIRDYIGEDSPLNARRFIERIFQAAEQLPEQPHSGRLVPEARRVDVRELLFEHYRIIYRVQPQRIQIITVIHGSRALAALPIKPWDLG